MMDGWMEGKDRVVGILIVGRRWNEEWWKGDNISCNLQEREPQLFSWDLVDSIKESILQLFNACHCHHALSGLVFYRLQNSIANCAANLRLDILIYPTLLTRRYN